jgi:lysozyme
VKRIKRPSKIYIADFLVLALVVVLFVFSPRSPYRQGPTGIPDKVVTYCYPAIDKDSLLRALQGLEAEKAEMGYYLRVHDIDDEGFHLVALYNDRLQQEYQKLQKSLRRLSASRIKSSSLNKRLSSSRRPQRIAAKDRPLVAVRMGNGYWKAGQFHIGRIRQGKALCRDMQGRIVSAVFDADTIVSGIRIDKNGVYQGQMDSLLQACGQGILDEWDGCHKEGFWRNDMLHGLAFDSSPLHPLRIGEWRDGRYLGERMKYTAQRIYGIDISRHQHEKGRRRYSINWRQLRITSLGHRHNTEGRTFPISFIYLKATEGTTVVNRYFKSDYLQARRQNIKVGAYHFFSLQTTAADQARHFLRQATIRPDDLPPVLDVEPSDAQIKKIGGDDVLMQRIRQFMSIVEQRTGKKPILYVSQMFIRNHMKNAPDIKQNYNVWIARYSQYRPDVKLAFWQLCPDGLVDGITGPVDINVFNGYQVQFQDFLRNGFY